MKKEVIVAKQPNETLSQAMYRSIEEAYTDFDELKKYVFNGYGNWVLKFGYDTPEDLDNAESLTFRFEAYRLNTLVHLKTFLIHFTYDEEETQVKYMQNMADAICEEVERFWDLYRQK